MFTWGVDGNTNKDVSLQYVDDNTRMSVNFAPCDAHAFFGKTGDTSLSGSGSAGTIKLEICRNKHIYMYLSTGPAQNDIGNLSVSLSGTRKVKSLLATLEAIRRYLSQQSACANG